MVILYFLACVLRPICLPVPEMLIIAFGRKNCTESATFSKTITVGMVVF